MNVSAEYYEKSLYPLQNGVLSIVEKSGTPFFLTGGTALSRYYTHHRYSDDLDFFVIQEPEYASHVNVILQKLVEAESAALLKLDHNSLNKGEAYTQLFVKDAELNEIELKVEFINDTVAHYGSTIHDPILGRIDSLRNILSNKLTTLLSRSEPKDVVDIHAIATKNNFNWRDIATEAKTKEAGADPEVIYDILNSFPLHHLDAIKWISRPENATENEIFKHEIMTIANDILMGRDNSLAPRAANEL